MCQTNYVEQPAIKYVGRTSLVYSTTKAYGISGRVCIKIGYILAHHMVDGCGVEFTEISSAEKDHTSRQIHYNSHGFEAMDQLTENST